MDFSLMRRRAVATLKDANGDSFSNGSGIALRFGVSYTVADSSIYAHNAFTGAYVGRVTLSGFIDAEDICHKTGTTFAIIDSQSASIDYGDIYEFTMPAMGATVTRSACTKILNNAAALNFAHGDVNDTTDVITITAHGLVDGDRVRLSARTGDLVITAATYATTGADGTNYYIKKVNDNSFELHTNADLVSAKVDLAFSGTGTNFIKKALGTSNTGWETLAWLRSSSWWLTATRATTSPVYAVDPADLVGWAPVVNNSQYTSPTDMMGSIRAAVHNSNLDELTTLHRKIGNLDTTCVVNLSDFLGAQTLSYFASGDYPSGAEGLARTPSGRSIFLVGDSVSQRGRYSVTEDYDENLLLSLGVKHFFPLNESSFADTGLILNGADEETPLTIVDAGTGAAAAAVDNPRSWSLETCLNITANSTGANNWRAVGASGSAPAATVQQFTLGVWLKTSTTPGSASAIIGVAVDGTTTDDRERFFIGQKTVNGLALPFCNFQTGAASPLKERYPLDETNQAFNTADGRWHLLIATIDLGVNDADGGTPTAGKMLLYYDGVLIPCTHGGGNNDAITYTSDWATPRIVIGATLTQNAAASVYVGKAKNAFLHEGIFTLDQIRAIYLAGPEPRRVKRGRFRPGARGPCLVGRG